MTVELHLLWVKSEGLFVRTSCSYKFIWHKTVDQTFERNAFYLWRLHVRLTAAHDHRPSAPSTRSTRAQFDWQQQTNTHKKKKENWPTRNFFSKINTVSLHQIQNI